LGDDEQFSVSFAVAAQQGLNRPSMAVLADSVIFGGHTLQLTAVDITLDEITIERSELSSGGDSDGDSDMDSDSDGPSNVRLRRAGTVIALPMQGGVITPIDESLPVGFYEEIELDFESVRLTGSYDGQPFDVNVPVKTELDVRFHPPIEIDAETDRINVTVAIDPFMWLRRADGALIDPRLFETEPELRAQFVNRIRASIRAFEDADRDADDADSDSDSDHSGRD
jgi:hypothetical protein